MMLSITCSPLLLPLQVRDGRHPSSTALWLLRNGREKSSGGLIAAVLVVGHDEGAIMRG